MCVYPLSCATDQPLVLTIIIVQWNNYPKLICCVHFLQSLLQLANFYAVWAPIGERPKFKSLSDRIGLCYLYKNRITCLDEVFALLSAIVCLLHNVMDSSETHDKKGFLLVELNLTWKLGFCCLYKNRG